MDQHILRGEIYYAELDPVIGSEQGGRRPVVILQNNKGNQFSSTVIVAPLTTSRFKQPLPTHVEVYTDGLRCTSTVLLEQIRTIDKQRIGDYVSDISEFDMRQIEGAILYSLEID